MRPSRFYFKAAVDRSPPVGDAAKLFECFGAIRIDTATQYEGEYVLCRYAEYSSRIDYPILIVHFVSKRKYLRRNYYNCVRFADPFCWL